MFFSNGSYTCLLRRDVQNVALPFAVTYYFNFKPDNILLKCPTEYSLSSHASVCQSLCRFQKRRGVLSNIINTLRRRHRPPTSHHPIPHHRASKNYGCNDPSCNDIAVQHIRRVPSLEPLFSARRYCYPSIQTHPGRRRLCKPHIDEHGLSCPLEGNSVAY